MVTAPFFPLGVAVAKLFDVGSLASYFESLDDPRHIRNRMHLLTDVLVISVAAVLCGCDGPTAIHRWAVNRKDWLAEHLALPNGIPSRDCIRRILIAVAPQAFQQCFQAWVAAMSPSRDTTTTATKPKRLIAIDGKSCRGSHDESKSHGPLHLVSAWASEEGLALGQVATEDKSNEITAIPVLLKQIGLKDTIRRPLLPQHVIPERQAIRGSGPQPLVDRIDVLDAGRDLPRRRSSHSRRDPISPLVRQEKLG